MPNPSRSHHPFHKANLRVLIVHDDNTTTRERIRSLLEDVRCEIVGEATSAQEAIRVSAQVAADLVLVPWALPESGAELLAQLRSATGDVYVVVFSSVPQADSAAGDALAAGADDYVAMYEDGALAATVATAHRLHGRQHAAHQTDTGDSKADTGGLHPLETDDARNVLVVDDDPAGREPIRRVVEREGGNVTEAASIAEAEWLLDHRVDAVVVDGRLPDGDAIDLIPAVSRRTPGANVVIWDNVDGDQAPVWAAHVPKANTQIAAELLGFGRPEITGPEILDASPTDVIHDWEEQCHSAQLPTPIELAQHIVDGLRAASPPRSMAIIKALRDLRSTRSKAVPIEAAVEALYRLRDTLLSHVETRGPATTLMEVIGRANALIEGAVAALAHHELACLRREAGTDELTGLPNRRAFERMLEIELARGSRYRRPFSVVVADLDGLKKINDNNGHVAGDRALQAFASAMRSSLRASDSAYRIGGDEFVMLLPETPTADIDDVLARIAIADAPTFSWGAATFPDDTTEPSQLFALADCQLLERRRQLRS